VADRSADEILNEVYRELAQIHLAVASRTASDTEIIPWTQRELKGLVDTLGAYRRARRETADAG
jgi:hypothetical protein